jgi:hypothetical protein
MQRLDNERDMGLYFLQTYSDHGFEVPSGVWNTRRNRYPISIGFIIAPYYRPPYYSKVHNRPDLQGYYEAWVPIMKVLFFEASFCARMQSVISTLFSSILYYSYQ